MKYNCIIFDNDGVLVDSEKISNKVMVEMALEMGAAIEVDFAMKYFSGISIMSTMEYIERKSGRKLPDNFEKKFRERTYAKFKTDLKPITGIPELLERITIPFCVASSGPQEKIILGLTSANLINFFESRIFSSYDINSWKPEPDIFLYAASEMGFQPNECAVIEDSLAGVKAAKSGGFNVFGFVQEENRAEFEHLGATVFSNMNELDRLLGLQ